MERTQRQLRLSLSLGLNKVAVMVVAGLALSACGSSAQSPGQSEVARLQVVATTTVFADMVRNVAGPEVAVDSLVPAGTDVHTFDPTPDDLVKVSRARVIVMNGLGLDDWLDKVVSNAGAVEPVKLGSLSDVALITGEGGPNPHLWMDVAYGEKYVDEIEATLSRADPAHAAEYAQNAAAYRTRLSSLDTWVKEQIASVPPANRRVVTFHDAFPYFARAYGLEVVGVAVDAPGQDPSAAQIAALIDAIRKSGVKAIFAEDQFSPKLVEQLAAETGTTVVSDLFDDSLGDPPVSSYEEVIRWDVMHIVDALK